MGNRLILNCKERAVNREAQYHICSKKKEDRSPLQKKKIDSIINSRQASLPIHS